MYAKNINNNNNECEFRKSLHDNDLKVNSEEVYKISATCIRQNPSLIQN
jgi:hypothetical protein